MPRLILTLSLILSCLVCFSQDTIPLVNYFGNLKKLGVSIGGKQYSFLFDTGGGETLISPEIAGFIAREPYGKTLGLRMTGEKIYFQKCDSVTIDFGTSAIFHPTLAVWDVMSVLPKELPKIDGVISLKSFKNRILTLDLANSWLIVETPLSYNQKIRTMTLLDSRVANGSDGNELIVFLGLQRNRHAYWFLLDSGNISQFLISPQTAYEWGLQDDAASLDGIHPSVVLFGGKTRRIEALTKEIIYDGVFNYEWVMRNVYIIDLLENRIWVD